MIVGEMMLLTEYRTRPGKRDELFRLFDRLIAHRGTTGRDFMVWSNSTTERDASFLFEYWSDADRFGHLFEDSSYLEYVVAVDDLVLSPPVTTVTVPRLIEAR